VPVDLVFDLEDTVEGTLWLETQEKIQGLALDSIPSTDRVVRQLVPWLLEHQDVPCILVCPDSVSSDPDAGTNERDDVVYRFLITFVFANDRNITDGMGLMAYWKQAVRRAMQNKSQSTWQIDLPSGTFLRSRIPDTTSPLLVAAKQQMGLNAMFLAVEFDVREPRE
jgi:hypothetical protein